MRKLKSQSRKVAEAELINVFILGLFCTIAALLILQRMIYITNFCIWFMYIVASLLAVVNSM